VLIAAFRRAAPTRCGAHADARCIVMGVVAAKRVKVPRFDPVREARARTVAPGRTGVLIATLRCDAPARCGAFADERRVVAGTKADGCTGERARPWSCRSLRAFRLEPWWG